MKYTKNIHDVLTGMLWVAFFAQLWAYGHMEKDGIMPTDYLYGALLLSQWLCLLAYIWLKAFNPAEESIHTKKKTELWVAAALSTIMVAIYIGELITGRFFVFV